MTLQESVRRKTLKFIAARLVSSALFGYTAHVSTSFETSRQIYTVTVIFVLGLVLFGEKRENSQRKLKYRDGFAEALQKKKKGWAKIGDIGYRVKLKKKIDVGYRQLMK